MFTQPSSPIAFVGREEELALLRARLDQACAGAGGIVLLAGEPGIGKTRTAEELAADARLRGASVLWGRCYEGEGAPAFWPWVQLIRAYARDRELAALRAELGRGAADVAQLVPELRDRLPDLPAPPPLAPAQARFRLFDSVTAFLIAAAQRRPLVLVLDDLHWADRPSLLLLEFLAGELRAARVLVLGTYRDVEVGRAHPLAQTLAELTRAQASQRIPLRGLSEHEVAHVIELTAGLAPPAPLVAAVTRETEGNPFFVAEVVRLLAAEGALDRPPPAASERLTLPPSVREVIGRRLARLSARCNRVLAIAAVIGREFDLATLQHAAGLGAGALLAVLEEAETARVIAALPRAPGRYAFGHALIREALYDDLPATRRLRLHARVGAALEACHGADLDAHLAELAYHFGQAAPAGEAARAVAYAQRAGARAMALLAYEEAAGHYERALQALAAGGPAADHQQGALLLALGDALRKAGEPQRALATFQRAAALARALGAPELLARAALGFENTVLPAGLARARAADPSVLLLEEARCALGEGRSALHVRVLAALARAFIFSGAPERGRELSQQAVDLARQAGDAAALAYALDARRIAIWGPDNLTERLAVTREIVQLAETVGDKEMALDGRLWRQNALVEQGDLAAAGAEIEAFARLAEAVRQPLYQCYILFLRASQALLTGRFAEGERLLGQALALGRRAQSQNTAMIHAAHLLVLRREQGRLGELESTFRAFAEQLPWTALFPSVLALLYCEAGRAAEARRLLETLAANEFADITRGYVWLLTMAFLAEVCAILGDTRRAAALYPLLLPYADHSILASSAGPCWGSAARYLGLLAATLCRWPEAAGHFAAARQAHARTGAWPWLARTQYDEARMLLARGRGGDRERAAELLAQALEAARQIGMPRLAGQVADLMDHVTPAPALGTAGGEEPRPAGGGPPAAPYPDHLTAREVEVLRLLAGGRSNKEIAARLSLSVRTVEHHVAHIYAKTGAGGRVAATAYALRHGLAPAGARPD